MPPPPIPPHFTLDLSTGLSLALAFCFLPAAQLVAFRVLPKSISRTHYWLFIWCAYDFLTHSIIEGSYLYHCFFSYETISITTDHPHPASLGSHGPYFLGYSDRNYGSFHSSAPLARLWQEYAKADSRWGGADLNVISIELLTVCLAGPAAAYICYLILRITNANDLRERARLEARMWFLAIVLSTGELYGGWMTFAPEWLSGCTALATGDVVYLWLYLSFFNTIWVWIPLWVLYVAYRQLSGALIDRARGESLKKAA